MKNIFCLNAISKFGTDMLTEDYQLVDEIGGADGVLVRSAAMHDMEFPESLKAIARAGAGVNNIPLDECAKKGIVVFNTPGANANGVKELVIAGMLLASRDVVGGIEWCQSIKEDPGIAKAVEKGKKAFAGYEIKGKKLGVIGLGAIGAEVANAAASLGMEVYGYDPFISVNGAWGLSRKGMINKTTIDQMKKGVVVLNFSRDSLVNDDDMAVALNEGKVHKYVTDFPNPKSANMAGAIVIPHLGASTEESEDNCAVMAVQEIMDYLENGNIKNSVNYPDCNMGECHAASRVAVLHMNIPNMIGQITGTVASGNVNITDMTNKSRDQYAYTMLDLEAAAGDEMVGKLKAIDGVLGVRVIK